MINKFFVSFLLGIFLLLPVAQAEVGSEDLAIIDNLSAAFERVSQSIKPSVVAIGSTKKAKKVKRNPQRRREFRGSPFDDFFGDDFFNRFFEHQFPDGGYSQQGLGSGVIVSEDGYILTNNHVIAGADEIKVTLYDDKEYTAELIGGDPKSDLAVIKIDAKDLKSARLGSSEDLKVGQWVVAAGNPFNLEQTITAGIVSAKGRSNVGIADYEDFIQTDAAINPGNSGGPLVNLKGEVVGINTAIFSKSGGYMGVGFAIPVDMAKSIKNSLIKDGKVVRGFLGVMIQKLNEGMAKHFGFNSTDGALVSEVNDDSPAKRAGVKEEDIIVSFDGKKVKDPSQLRNLVGQTDPDKSIEMKVFRNGEYKTLSVKVGTLKTDNPKIDEEAAESANELGIDVSDITPEIKYKLDLKDDSGVVITYVEPGSLAQFNGLKRGDVILKVDNKTLKSKDNFFSILKKIDLKKGVLFSVKRKGGKLFLFIKE